MHVVYVETVDADVEAVVRECLPPGYTLRVRRPGETPESILGEADFILIAASPLTAAMIAAAPKARLIQHQGVGYNAIDLEAAARANLPLAINPAGSIIPVAEHTFALILSLYRQLARATSALRQGEWLNWKLRPTSYNVAGKHLGIIGLGRIGKQVAKRARAFECRVSYYDIVRPPAAFEAEYNLQFLALDDLLQQADIVTVHVPLDASTRGMIAARELVLMQGHAILINTARGGIVDEAALYEALRTQQIAGAGFDVFVQEPLPLAAPLLALDNLVATPHIAAGTRDALVDKMQAAFANMERVARGEPPLHQVMDALQ